jgi:ComF family protein
MTVWAAGLFDGYYRRLLHHFKFNGRMDAGALLGHKLAGAVSRSAPPVDALVPVPLHPARQRERGYNQSAYLAHVLGVALDLPVVEHLIQRVRNTPSQTDLGREKRQLNVLQAFTVEASLPAVEHILLVDDVLTTGSTLESCRHTLTEAGFNVAGAAVVALAEPPAASYTLQAAESGAVRKTVRGG